ncbi:MAG: DNRLRE domain-containing protein [Bacteroidia bacterium]|nr:DNRLRE domain-containing protein [Bacteroidia bacterium]
MKHFAVINLLVFISFLIIHNNLFGQTTITLQPNATDGKDALVWDLHPSTNYGSSNEFSILAWTFNGTPEIERCFIDFNFSLIPAGATITSATLFLYNYPNSQSCSGEHSQLSGSNAMFVERVIGSWNEQTITWNNQPNVTTQNQVSVPASSSIHQNYTINVASLVQDIVDNPSNSFGLRLNLQTEQYYRSLIFASSDVSDTTLHPKIVITYTLNNEECYTLRPNSTDGKDALVWDLHPSTNYGSSNEFNILGWTYSGTPEIQRSFIDFNFSLIPDGATITSATLFLYNFPNSQSCSGEHSQLSGSNAMFVERVIGSWNEQTITWNNQPNVTTQNQVSVPASSTIHQNYTINVTSLVQDIVNNPTNSFGLSLKLQNEQYYRSVIFASSDVNDTTLHPKIEICYVNQTDISEKNYFPDNINIYPNPATNLINIEPINSINGYLKIDLLNIHGKLLYSSTIKNKTSIDVSKYVNGIYFIKMTSENSTNCMKIIKQ